MLLKENVLKVLDDLYREQTMSKCQTQEECKNLRLGVLKALYTVKEMPTVDAVPVVRCEDCIWHRERNKKEQAYLIEGVLICTNVEATDGGWLPVFPTHFCSYGERKDGGAND